MPHSGGAGLVEGRTISGQFAIQLTGLIATRIWSASLSLILVMAVEILVGFRIERQPETEAGLLVTLRCMASAARTCNVAEG